MKKPYLAIVIDAYWRTPPCLTPPSGGTPWDIDVIYTSLKSAFNGLQFSRWHYGSIFIRLAVVASQSRELTRNSDKIWPYSSSRSSKIIDLGVNRKPMYDFLLVITVTLDYLLPFSRYSRLKLENCWFYPPLPCLTLTSGGTPWDIDVIYTPLKGAFNGLQFRRWHYGSIFIRLAVVASQSREITRNSVKIWPYSSSRSSKVIDLGVNRKPMYDFLLVTNSDLGPICYRFRDIDT